ncbi:MAG: fumarylacetoacetate hydrolase family protein [Synergistaceae bacterium]|jgi:2-keto-4-pentenoate hydratase/2-oxohepta-3-ene-1,7-dioic acid hydratase in catechol pathway|nr:fumarylacetoacetate hydrolase family protein [Synergistaceae bacterium]
MIRDIAAPLKYCRFTVDGKTYSGTLHGNMVDLAEGDFLTGFSTLRMSYPLERIKLLPPFVPAKIWCVGRNYTGHVRELDHELPAEPLIFMKPATAIIGSGDPVRIPEWAGRVDYEGELAVVIGRKCHKVSEQDALAYTAGYSCFNDVTARDLQNSDGQWTRAKGFDTFAPFGPVILLTQSMPADAEITTRLNGKIVQRDSLGSMIFPVSRIISHISRFATLEPGDVIATGTPEGVSRVRQGDRVEVEIEGIGVLSNPFIADH